MESKKTSGELSAHASKPLDGSQYRNIIEEQVYAELPPSQEEQQPVRARHLEKTKAPLPHVAMISVGITENNA